MDHSALSYLDRQPTEKLELIFREYNKGENENIYEGAWQDLLIVLQRRWEMASSPLQIEVCLETPEQSCLDY